MSPRFPVRVLAPACELTAVDGVRVALLSIEIWGGETVLHLAVLEDARTAALDAAYGIQMERWAGERRSAGGAVQAGEPPSQPGERLLRLALELSDDVGTAYRPLGTSAGGTGTAWRSQWQFEPGVPPDAAVLTVSAPGGDGHPDELDVALR